VETTLHKPWEKPDDKFGDEFLPRYLERNLLTCEHAAAFFDRLGRSGISMTRQPFLGDSPRFKPLSNPGEIRQKSLIPIVHMPNNHQTPF
jgi:hypothetical protein